MASEADQGVPIPVKVGTSLNPTWTATATPPAEPLSVPQAPPEENTTTSQAANAAQPPSAPIHAPAAQPLPVPAPAVSPVSSVSETMPTPAQFQSPVTIEPASPASPAPSPIPQVPLSPIPTVTAPVVASSQATPTPDLLPNQTTQPVPEELAVVPPVKEPPQVPWRALGIILGVLLILGGTLGYFVWQGLLFGTPRDSRLAMSKMLTAFVKVQAYHFEGESSVTIGDLPKNITTQAAATPNSLHQWIGVAEAQTPAPTDIATPQVTPTPLPSSSSVTPPILPARDTPITLNLRLTGDRVDPQTSQTTISLDISALGALLPSTLPSSVEVDTRQVGGQMYLRVPVLSLFMGSASNKWLSFNERDLQTLTKTNLKTQTWDATKLAQLIKQGERVGYETIGPVRTGHYRLVLDPTTAAVLLDLLSNQQSFHVDQYLQKIGLTAEVWVGVNDQLPYRVKLGVTYTDGQTVDKIVTTISLSGYGKTTTIAAPGPDEVSTEGLDGLIPTNLDASKAKARDAKRKSDINQLKSALELYKGDHGSYPTTNGLTVKTNDPKSILGTLKDAGYIKGLPIDPLDPTDWYGYKSPDGKSFEVWSLLEDASDSDAIQRDKYTLYLLKDDASTNTTATPTTPVPTPCTGQKSLPTCGVTPTSSPTTSSARLPV